MRNPASRSILLALALVLSGCASSRPPVVLEPAKTSAIYPYYVAGVPYAHVALECADLICCVIPDPNYNTGGASIRAHLWYTNRSDEAHLLAPLQDLSITIVDNKGKETTMSPRSPSKILASIRGAKTASLIGQAFAGAVQAALVQSTRVSTPHGTLTIDDTYEKVQNVIDRTAASMEVTAASSAALETSVDRVILRRNTVFPGRTVGGIVYFPDPFRAYRGLAYSRFESHERLALDGDSAKLILSIHTPCEDVEVEFYKVPGE